MSVGRNAVPTRKAVDDHRWETRRGLSHCSHVEIKSTFMGPNQGYEGVATALLRWSGSKPAPSSAPGTTLRTVGTSRSPDLDHA